MRWWWLMVVFGCSTGSTVAPGGASGSQSAGAIADTVPVSRASESQTRGDQRSVFDLSPSKATDQIQRGYRLAEDTHRLLPDNVGAGLNCTNCHLQNATKDKAAPWIGVNTRYPKYRNRSGKVDDLQDRMNGCFERSMNGKALPRDSEPMLALVAYANWLSEGVEDGKSVKNIGMPKIKPPASPSSERGGQIYQAKCAACHQPNGAGVFSKDDTTLYPPLWGPRSYNIGAGMARLNTAAAFVKWNMPLNQGGTLTDQEANDVASFIIFQDRPDLKKKSEDWPKGHKPADARY